MCADAIRPPRSARPSRAAAPTMPTLDALDRMHAQVMGTLSQVAALITHLRDNGADDTARRYTTDICASFADHARQHHADEERTVFPRAAGQRRRRTEGPCGAPAPGLRQAGVSLDRTGAATADRGPRLQLVRDRRTQRRGQRPAEGFRTDQD
jgi:hypothetical protein